MQPCNIILACNAAYSWILIFQTSNEKRFVWKSEITVLTEVREKTFGPRYQEVQGWFRRVGMVQWLAVAADQALRWWGPLDSTNVAWVWYRHVMISGCSLLFVLALLRGFFSGYSSFPPSKNQRLQIPNQGWTGTKRKTRHFSHHWNGGGVVLIFHLYCLRLQLRLMWLPL